MDCSSPGFPVLYYLPEFAQTHVCWVGDAQVGDDEAEAIWPPDVKSQLIRKDPEAGKEWRQEEKGTAEDEIVGWNHWLNEHEYAQPQGEGEGLGSLSSVQFSRSVMSRSLWPHGLKHASPPCPSPTPGVYSNSHPLSRWCHPTISSSGVPFSSCLQSFPASGAFQMSQHFASGGQSIGVSTSASILPVNIQDWFPLGLTGLIFLQSKGLSRVFSNTHSSKASIIWCSAFFTVQLSHPYMTTGKTIALTRWTFVNKIMSLLFNTLSRFVIVSLPQSKHLSISWLQSPSAMILEPPQNKDGHCCPCFYIYLPWSDGTRCHDLSLLNVDF